MVLATAVTGLIIVLGALVGVGVGCLFMLMSRTPPEVQRERELQIAKETARRTFNQTLTALFPDQPQ